MSIAAHHLNFRGRSEKWERAPDLPRPVRDAGSRSSERRLYKHATP